MIVYLLFFLFAGLNAGVVFNVSEDAARSTLIGIFETFTLTSGYVETLLEYSITTLLRFS